MTTRQVDRWRMVGAGSVLLVALVACGGGGKGDAAGVPTASAGDTTAGATATSAEDDGFAWAACMREHGIPYSDPDPLAGKPILELPEGNPGGDKVEPADGGIDDAAIAEAEEACREYAVAYDTAPDPGLQAEREELLLEWTQCMRDHGVEIDDENTDPAGRDPNAAPSADAPAPQVYEAAEEACRAIAERGADG